MGDRVNIVMEYADKSRVFFYGHWSGEDALPRLQTALARQQRWNDDAYLARIIFCEFVKGSEADETGFGISTSICDNEHPLIIVDTAAMTVRLEATGDERGSGPLSFADFVAVPTPDWDSFPSE